MASTRLLLIDDESIIHEVFDELLKPKGYDIDHVYTLAGAAQALEFSPYDLVLLDVMLPDGSGDQFIPNILKKDPALPVIVITAFGSVNSAVQAMKTGAFDYITKPFHNDEVLRIVDRAIQHRKIELENRMLKQNLELSYKFENIIGKSRKMQELYDLIERVAPSKSTILITGESGTGKELIARAIHMKSQRSAQPFTVVTCSNIPPELLESELFGHEKGAFTGAVEMKRGLLEIGNGGTVFLDEIGTMPISTQAKLLRVLQEREFKRLGGVKTFSVDIRFIAASNEDPEHMVKVGKFREDLYYRLNVIMIALPPLRERPEDIPLLVRHFLRRYGKENNKPNLEITDRALHVLAEYSWPGNVRELEHTIERAVVLAQTDILDLDLLPETIIKQVKDGGGKHALMGHYREGFKEKVDHYKRALILEALERAGWVQKKAAQMLRMKPTTLHEMMKRYGIKTETPPPE